jgi:phosphatidylglycerol---prolipoprotein diacylglyceryl transferase
LIPQLFNIPLPFGGHLPVNSFGLMVALGLLSAIYMTAGSFRRQGINAALADRYVLVAGFTGLIGARMLYILEHLEDLEDGLAEALFSTAGFTFYGGFILAAIALMIMAKRDKIPISTIADSAGLALTLAYAIGRLGCQLSGDGDYGLATTSLLGMSYEGGVVPTPPGVMAYPTPLYESAVCLGMLWVLLKLDSLPAWQRPLRRFGAYLTLIALERFMIEFIRVNPKLWSVFSEAQLIALGLAALGLYFAWPRAARQRVSSG